MINKDSNPTFDPATQGGGTLLITPASLDAGVAYLFASGLVPWNEPRQVAAQYIEELLSVLDREQDQAEDRQNTKSSIDAKNSL